MATSKKISKQALDIDYDSSADVLYVSFGKPKAAICVEDKHGNLLRYDAYSDKLIGITIIDFKKRYVEEQLSEVEESAKAVVSKILKGIKIQ